MRHSIVALTLALGLLSATPIAAAAPLPYRIAAAYSSNRDKELLIAVFKSDPEWIQASLAAGASPNARFLGDLFSEEDALDFGVGLMEDFPAFTRLTQANEQRLTALLLAARDGQHEIVKLLLAQGADPNKLSGDRKLRPLMQAVRSRNEAIARSLLAAGADVNQANASGETALCFAVHYDSPELASLLLNEGARVQGLQVRGMPLVAGAIAHRRFDLAEALIARGADVGPRACMVEAVRQGSLTMVRTLVSRGTAWDAREVRLAREQHRPEIEAFLRSELARRQKV